MNRVIGSLLCMLISFYVYAIDYEWACSYRPDSQEAIIPIKMLIDATESRQVISYQYKEGGHFTQFSTSTIESSDGESSSDTQGCLKQSFDTGETFSGADVIFCLLSALERPESVPYAVSGSLIVTLIPAKVLVRKNAI